MIRYQILIDGIDYTHSVALPFKEQYVLDSALDNGVLTLAMIERKDIFKPFTPITITKDNDTYTMYIASDKVTEIVGSGLYTHDLVLIEETKLLEKKVVDTNTTTQPLIHDYEAANGSVYVTSEYSNQYITVPGDYYNDVVKTIMPLSTSSLPSARAFLTKDTANLSNFNFFASINNCRVMVTLKDNNNTIVAQIDEFDNTALDTELQLTQLLDGNYLTNQLYSVEYRVSEPNIPSNYLSNTFEFWGFSQEQIRPKKSITDVVNRLLAITDTLRVSEINSTEYPRLKFNQEQADFYDQRDSDGEPLYPAPEFSMTKSTLRECLDQVGSYIHSIVRLVGNEIYFDKLGGTQEYSLNYDYTNNYTINYEPNISGNLETDIKFIVNGNTYNQISTHGGDLWYDNEAVYSIFGNVGTRWKHEHDPYTNFDYRKIQFLEKPTGSLLTWLQNNAVQEVKLKDHIGHYETLDVEQYASQLDSIVSNITNIDDETTGTITEPFLNNYKTLRAETGTIRINDQNAIIKTDYPIEKIAKLECGYITVNGTDYLVGDITPYVYESAEYSLLSSYESVFPISKCFAIKYTQGQPNITDLLFKQESASEFIIKQPAILNIISQKIGQQVQTLFNVQNITELQFRLIYYPSTTARVKQSRTDITNYDQELTSIYNQNANKVDSRAYGENLKGAIARLGNIEKFITYELSSPDDLPNAGEYVIIDNEDYYIATISVENQIDHTKVTLGLSKDFNALSKYIGIKNNIRMYEVSEKQTVQRFVTYEDYCVIGKSITSDEKNLTNYNMYALYRNQFCSAGLYNRNLPITVAEMKGTDKSGNSLQAVYLPVFSLAEGNSVWLGCKYEDNYSAGEKSVNPPTLDSGYYRLGQYVEYADYFGEIETLKIDMYRYKNYAPETKAEALVLGNAFPQKVTIPHEILSAVPSITTGNDDLVIKKDSREQINFSYQLHFVTNDGIIIGTQLAQGNTMVTNVSQNYAKLYILPNRINKFADKIDLTGATLVKSYENQGSSLIMPDETGGETEAIIFNNETANANGKSWVLVDNINERLLFGKNIAIENGDTIVMPRMTFTHKVI